MEYVLTYQSAVMERPVVRSFEDSDEANEYVKMIKEMAEESRLYWKIEPTLSVEN